MSLSTLLKNADSTHLDREEARGKEERGKILDLELWTPSLRSSVLQWISDAWLSYVKDESLLSVLVGYETRMKSTTQFPCNLRYSLEFTFFMYCCIFDLFNVWKLSVVQLMIKLLLVSDMNSFKILFLMIIAFYVKW